MIKCEKCRQKFLPTVSNSGNCPACIDRAKPRQLIESLSLEDGASIAARKVLFQRITGIYFLLRKDKVVYVGKSINIIARVFKHNYKFDSFSYIECAADDLDLYEVAYISKFKPRYNCYHNIPVKKPANQCSTTI